MSDEDNIDTSDWAVPPMPDRIVIADLRAEVERLRLVLEEIAAFSASPVCVAKANAALGKTVERAFAEPSEDMKVAIAMSSYTPRRR